MPSAAKASSSLEEPSPLDAVRAALAAMEEFAPKHDATKLAALKEEAEKLRKRKRENTAAQRNEKRKRERILRKGSGWEKNDILECFRLKHENEMRRARAKQAKEDRRFEPQTMPPESSIAPTPIEGEEPECDAVPKSTPVHS